MNQKNNDDEVVVYYESEYVSNFLDFNDFYRSNL